MRTARQDMHKQMTGRSHAFCVALSLCAAMIPAPSARAETSLTSSETQSAITSAFSYRSGKADSAQTDLTAFFDGAGSGAFAVDAEDKKGTFELFNTRNRSRWYRLQGSWVEQESYGYSYALAEFGTHRWISDHIFIGALLELDRSRKRNSSSRHNGYGALAGPYLAWRAAKTPLSAQLRLLYGRSRNAIGATQGPAQHYGARRALAQFKLDGTMSYKQLTFSPFFDARHMFEGQISSPVSPEATSQSSYAKTKLNYGLKVERELLATAGILTLTSGLKGNWVATDSSTSQSLSHNAKLDFEARFNFESGEEMSVSARFDGVEDGLDTPALSFGYKFKF